MFPLLVKDGHRVTYFCVVGIFVCLTLAYCTITPPSHSLRIAGRIHDCDRTSHDTVVSARARGAIVTLVQPCLHDRYIMMGRIIHLQRLIESCSIFHQVYSSTSGGRDVEWVCAAAFWRGVRPSPYPISAHLSGAVLNLQPHELAHLLHHR